MPHTRAVRLRALKEAAECGNIQQMPHSTTNMGCNDHLGWDLPGLTYQSDALAWHPREEMIIDQNLFFGDSQTPTAAANGLPDIICGPSSTSDFYSTRPWNSTSAHDSWSVKPAVSIPSPPPESEYTSYESTSLDEDSRPAHQRYHSQTWPPQIISQTSSLSDEVYSHKSSKKPALELNEKLYGTLPLGTEVESDRVSNPKPDASKKRKFAHSVVEKHYRSKIKDAMAELRHCVPSTARVRSSYDSKCPKSQQAADKSTSNRSSRKVATLSDAVEYVKALEILNEALNRRLDIIQRRNHILQRIALSKNEHSTNQAIS